MPRFSATAPAQRAMIWVACILMLMVFACQRRTTEVISGIEIPIPGKMTKNTDKSFEPIPGFEDGQVSYQGKVSPSDIFTFYQEVMAADGWQPTARFADKKDRIAYFKGNRLVLIRYNDSPDGNGNTVLTIFAGTDVAAK